MTDLKERTANPKRRRRKALGTNGPGNGSTFRAFAMLALTAALLALCALVVWPFLSAITWSVALAILAWPLHRRIIRWIPNENWSAAATTLIVVAVIVIPGVLLSYRLVGETAAVAQQVNATTADDVRSAMDRTPFLANVRVWLEGWNVDVVARAADLIKSYAGEAFSLARGSLTAILQFLLVVFMLYYLIRDRAAFLTALRGLLPISHTECDRVLALAADSVHANLFATVTTSAINAVTGGVVLWSVGISSATLWAVMIFVLGVIPVVGAGMVWVPAIIFLASNDHWLGALVVLIWGLLSAVFVDNVFYARMAGERMRIHPLIALVAFLGGIAVFGIAGMILGPAIVAVTGAFLDFWRQRNLASEQSAAG